MTEITIVFPEADDDEISDGLRTLTAACRSAFPDEDWGYGLGGENGYGVNHENDVFMMHRFCWCSGYECPWCSYSGEEGAHFQERHRARGALPDLDCGQAPNFWHKPSGVRVIWYKWIGRDNAVHVPDGVRFADVLADCLTSIAPTAKGASDAQP
jgi:hypothetical protein